MPDHRPAIAADPNVTPMIDVLLVLLIIFMAAIPSARRALDAQLPHPEPTAGDAAATIVLEVGREGRLALNRQPVRANELEARLRAVYAGRPDKTLIVKGDTAVRYQEVISAMDIARAAGVRVIGVDTRY